MKKTFTCSFLFAVCFTFFTAYSKEVKPPVKVANNTASTYSSTSTQTSNQNQTNHTCSGSSDDGGGEH